MLAMITSSRMYKTFLSYVFGTILFLQLTIVVLYTGSDNRISVSAELTVSQFDYMKNNINNNNNNNSHHDLSTMPFQQQLQQQQQQQQQQTQPQRIQATHLRRHRLQQQQQHLQKLETRKNNIQDDSSLPSVLCRIIVIDTMFVDDDTADDNTDASIKINNKNVRVEETPSCIPIIDGKETDDLYKLSPSSNLAISLRSQHEETMRLGSLYINLYNVTRITRSGPVSKNNIASTQQLRLRTLPSPDFTNTDTTYSSSTTGSSYGLQISDYTTFETIHSRNLQLDNEPLLWKSSMSISVIRVSTIDSQPQDSTSDLRDTLFNPSKVNLRTQYASCSFGKINLYPSPSGDVIDVQVQQPIRDFENSYDDLIIAAQNTIKASNPSITSMEQIADRIIFCLPPGTGSWAASAGVRYWRMQMNDAWCHSLTGSMHELGHTFGLLHSHADGIEYNDRTGYMGSGGTDRTTPQKCFNGFQSYQFGWYGDRTKHYDPLSEGNRLIFLSAFVDKDKTDIFQPVLLVIDNSYFLQYNRAKSFNVGTEQRADEVTVTQPIRDGTDALMGLFPGGGVFTRTNYKGSGRTLFVEACKVSESTSSQPDVMILSVSIDQSICNTLTPAPVNRPTQSPIKPPTNAPVTKPPTKSPTAEPIMTRWPVSIPTFQPVSKPTFQPISRPTISPISKPTYQPIENPTYAPISNPTFPPINKPTFQPIYKPTFPPINKPTFPPIAKPTYEPTSEPIYIPVRAPSVMPFSSPTDTPVSTPSFNPRTKTSAPSAIISDVPSSGLVSDIPSILPSSDILTAGYAQDDEEIQDKGSKVEDSKTILSQLIARQRAKAQQEVNKNGTSIDYHSTDHGVDDVANKTQANESHSIAKNTMNKSNYHTTDHAVDGAADKTQANESHSIATNATSKTNATSQSNWDNNDKTNHHTTDYAVDGAANKTKAHESHSIAKNTTNKTNATSQSKWDNNDRTNYHTTDHAVDGAANKTKAYESHSIAKNATNKTNATSQSNWDNSNDHKAEQSSKSSDDKTTDNTVRSKTNKAYDEMSTDTSSSKNTASNGHTNKTDDLSIDDSSKESENDDSNKIDNKNVYNATENDSKNARDIEKDNNHSKSSTKHNMGIENTADINKGTPDSFPGQEQNILSKLLKPEQSKFSFLPANTSETSFLQSYTHSVKIKKKQKQN